ncbi:Ribonuclease H [Quillaja saponaria]|uniref:Ribonuclease H n=1 Tax=Quillaja saponaria TaxID=32244 RepID=A0AAD7PL80_QUISA|nr:Ribonuclease H [Quillaja saponaria]
MACDFCGFYCQDCLHAIRDCPYALNIWVNLVLAGLHSSFFTADFKSWLTGNLKSSTLVTHCSIPCYSYLTTRMASHDMARVPSEYWPMSASCLRPAMLRMLRPMTRCVLVYIRCSLISPIPSLPI